MQLRVRMTSRDPEEEHRTATPLELFFDLTFVVAIAQAASSLHHGLVDGDAGGAILGFPLVFFAVWWAWVNFTWFASAYDTDDALYRLAVFVQVTGVLILAAGVPRALDDQDFVVMASGYVVIRLALVALWLRVARSEPTGRAGALRSAVGITVVQAGWMAWQLVPDGLFLPGFVVLLAAEIAVPAWAEAASRTSWHPGHIAERYGLFTIIVLGESVLAATVGVQEALDGDGRLGDLAPVVIGGLLIVFSMWWTYFDMPAETAVGRARRAFIDQPSNAFAWSYLHYFVFAGVAAAGAGLAVAVDHATGASGLSEVQAGWAITIPVSVYLVAVWALHRGHKRPGPWNDWAVPVTTALVLAATLTPEPVLLTGVILGVLVAVNVVVSGRERMARAS